MDQATQLRNLIKRQEVVGHTAKVITVTSGKGGVGKSNVSINLAIAFSRLGQRVVVLDADFGLANIEVMLGIRPQYSLGDMLFRGKSVKEIITRGPENIGFISGGSGLEELLHLDSYQINQLSEKLYDLDELADYIIIDTGAGISDALHSFIRSSDYTLLVATPEPTSITDAYAVLKALSRQREESDKIPSIYMVSNRVESREEGKSLYHKLNVVVQKFLQVEFLYAGPVLQDKYVMKAVMEQSPIMISYPSAPAAKTIMELGRWIHDGTGYNENKGGIRRLFSNFLKQRY